MRHQHKSGRARAWLEARALIGITLIAAGCGMTATSGAAERAAKPLITGPDFAAWRQPIGEWQLVGDARMDPANPKQLAVEPPPLLGADRAQPVALYNGPKGRTQDLVSVEEFGDCVLHAEFMIPKGSNSGIYLMDSYEIQIYDTYEMEQVHYPGQECGGIYQRWDPARGKGKEGFDGHSPKVKAMKAPGEWQTFDIEFRTPRFDAAGQKTANARMVRMLFNGQLIHENVELSGPTRGGKPETKPAGPLRIQGNHGPVAFRNLTIAPLAP